MLVVNSFICNCKGIWWESTFSLSTAKNKNWANYKGSGFTKSSFGDGSLMINLTKNYLSNGSSGNVWTSKSLGAKELDINSLLFTVYNITLLRPCSILSFKFLPAFVKSVSLFSKYNLYLVFTSFKLTILSSYFSTNIFTTVVKISVFIGSLIVSQDVYIPYNMRNNVEPFLYLTHLK